MESDRMNMARVANAVGVSVMTVSRVLRGSAGVSRQTREKVEEALKALDYRPNPMISTLMAQIHGKCHEASPSTLAWISTYPNTQSWWVNESQKRTFLGAQARASQLGYTIETFHLKEPGMTSRRLEGILRTRGIRGILIAPSQSGASHISMSLRGFASVSMGATLWRPRLYESVNHHLHTIQTATYKLKRHGYERIGLYLIHSTDVGVHFAFSAGFTQFQRGLKRKNRVPLLIEDAWNYDVFSRWVKRHHPDAILTIHYEALSWLKHMALAVPRDLGFAHLDVQPSMIDCAGVDQRHEESGAAAVEMVTMQINQNKFGVPEKARVLMAEGEWVEGKTLRYSPAAIARKS